MAALKQVELAGDRTAVRRLLSEIEQLERKVMDALQAAETPPAADDDN